MGAKTANVNHDQFFAIMYTVYMCWVLTHIIFDMDASLNKRISVSRTASWRNYKHYKQKRRGLHVALQKERPS